VKINQCEHQLFVDDALIEYSNNLQRRYWSPERAGVVLEPDKPWEQRCLILYGSVIKDPVTGNFKMWYSSFCGKRNLGRDILYAESTDGFHWHKPNLGLVKFKDSLNNNIVIPAEHPYHPDGASVIYDTVDKKKSRLYKMVSCRTDNKGKNHIWANFSADGIRWQGWNGPILFGYGDRNTLMFDPSLEKPYVIFTRPPDMMKNFGKRIVVRLDSKDFIRWTQSQTILKPDLDDPLDLQFYCLVAFKYHSMYLGFLQRLHSEEDRLDIELVSSRDSITWHRSDLRTAFMESNFEKSIDSRWIGLASNPPIVINNYLLFFYEARNACHGLSGSFLLPSGLIGVATMPEDGFVSLSSGFVPAEIVTKSFVCPGGVLKLRVNAVNHLGHTETCGIIAGGTRLEILTENHSPIPGYSLKECKTITGNFRTGVAVEWKKKKELNALKGQKIRLRFNLIHSDLYSFWFDECSKT